MNQHSLTSCCRGVRLGLTALIVVLAASARAGTEVWRLAATSITDVANGGAVSNWPSSSGPSATQAAAANRPLWYNSDANLPNGRPIVRFVRDPALSSDPNGDSLLADFTSSCAQPLTFFIVAYIRPVNDGNMYLFDSRTGNNRLCLYQPTDNNKFNMYAGGDFTAVTQFTNKWILYEAQFNGASSKMYTNGTLSGSGNAGAGGITAADDLVIGRRYNDNVFELNGDIAEIILYQGTITDAERNAIGNNLGAFYGISTKYAGTLAAAFSATPTNGPAPQTVTFTDFSTGVPVAWSWTFGDGGVSTLQNPTHTYATGGTYDVTLTVTNAFGSNTLTRTGCIVLTNPPPPVAGFSANITTGSCPVVVTFTNQSSGQVNSSLWDFGDGSNSVAQNPLHLYTTSGVYTVSLTVGNPGGSNTMTRSNYITVTPSPAGGKPLEFRADALVGLTNGQFMSLWPDTSGNGRDVGQNNAARKPFYATNRINGLPAVQFRSTYNSYGNCLTNTGYSIAQPYTIFMVARSDGNNGANSSDVFLDGYPGSANRIFISLSWYGGLQANFYSYAGMGPLSFPWTQSSWSNWHVYEMQFAGTNSAVWVDGSYRTSGNAGTWPLSGMTLGDHQAYNCGVNGEMAEFVVYSGSLSSTDRYNVGSALCSKYGLGSAYSPPEVPLAAIFSASPTNGPTPLTVTFSDLSTGSPTNWAWTFGDGSVSALAGPVHTYSTAGVYTVSLVVSGAGSVSTNTKAGYIVVTNPPPPVADFTGTPVTGAYPLAVAFTDQSAGQRNAWSWNFGDGWGSTLQNPTHVYGTAGVFTVTLTASNPGGSNTVTKAGYITATNPPPAVEVLRLRASSISGVTNGGNVATWTAMTGPNATQTNAVKQPVWVNSGLDLPNGQPVVRFNRDPSILVSDPNGDFMRVAFAGDYPQPLTVFLVAQIRPVTNGNAFVYDDNAFVGDNARFVMYQGGNSSNMRIYQGGQEFGFTDAALTNGWHILEASYSGSASTFYMDGTVKATGAVGAGGLQAVRGLKIGSRYDDSFQLNGDIAEMIIYSGLLIEEARNEAGSRLAYKYGLLTEYPEFRPPGSLIIIR
jgi:PKD repeat protein